MPPWMGGASLLEGGGRRGMVVPLEYKESFSLTTEEFWKDLIFLAYSSFSCLIS